MVACRFSIPPDEWRKSGTRGLPAPAESGLSRCQTSMKNGALSQGNTLKANDEGTVVSEAA